MFRRLGVLAAALVAAAGLSVPASQASSHMLIGFFDEAHVLYGEPQFYLPIMHSLHAQVIRVGMYWGGKFGVARSRPGDATDPADPAYDWTLYDRTVLDAGANGLKVLFSIYGTPSWENGGAGPNHAPASADDLRKFALAAATRYSGTYPGPDGRMLPAVKLWLAWNEPNNPVFLTPQWQKVGGKYVVQSAIAYAKICAAVYSGIHGTMNSGEQVACGATSPRGNNSPSSGRPSTSPLVFLKAVKTAGLKRFDAWAHHPYYGGPNESPTTKPPTLHGVKPTAVTLANIGDLINLLTQLYGHKPVWITEYGYQTNPPDPQFGVSLANQAKYLTQAFGIARANPRIVMMLWFMLKDEPVLSGWQSGLLTAAGAKKPSFTAFANLHH